jgi:hypothetical protein
VTGNNLYEASSSRHRDPAEHPYYLPVGGEVEVFEAAWRRGLAVMLKGPTG